MSYQEGVKSLVILFLDQLHINSMLNLELKCYLHAVARTPNIEPPTPIGTREQIQCNVQHNIHIGPNSNNSYISKKNEHAKAVQYTVNSNEG